MRMTESQMSAHKLLLSVFAGLEACWVRAIPEVTPGISWNSGRLHSCGPFRMGNGVGPASSA